jgi:phenylalanyl-tRNA synthetase beta chain
MEGAALVPGKRPHPWLVSSEAFSVVDSSGETLGFAGRIDAPRIDAPAWAGPVWALELALPDEPAPRPTPVYEPLPAFPGVDRDLALLLPAGMPVREVEALILGTAGPLLVGLAVFDLYEGEGIPEGHRSVAFRLRYQSGQRTLTDEDVERSIREVTDRLREELGVEPRG